MSLDLDGSLVPHAKVDAVATLSVDVVIAEAGVKGRLTLVDIRLPFRGLVGIDAPQGDPENLALTVNAGLDVELRTLAGSVSVYVRFLFEETEKVIFSWKGLGKTWNAFEASVTVPLNGLLDFLES